MKVTAFDFYDKERKNPIELDIKKKHVKKDEQFKLDDVTYLVTKVFSKKGYESKCIEVKMVAYKIPNTVTTFAHKCPAKKNQMEQIRPDHREELEKKFGKQNVDAWTKGKVKMKTGSVTSVCPDCGVVFWKEKVELPQEVEVVSLKGKKKLVKRK